MKRRCFVAAMASTLLTSIPVTLWAGLKVEPDKENVVASRLEGGWQPEGGLTQRLIISSLEEALYLQVHP